MIGWLYRQYRLWKATKKAKEHLPDITTICHYTVTHGYDVFPESRGASIHDSLLLYRKRQNCLLLQMHPLNEDGRTAGVYMRATVLNNGEAFTFCDQKVPWDEITEETLKKKMDQSIAKAITLANFAGVQPAGSA